MPKWDWTPRNLQEKDLGGKMIRKLEEVGRASDHDVGLACVEEGEEGR